MNVPIHPMLVHVPLGLAVILPAIAVILGVAIWRGRLRPIAWAAVVALQAVLFAGGLAALHSGEGEEERVESVVPEAVLEGHEDAARIFVGLAAATLVVGALALLGKKRLAHGAIALSAALTFAVLGSALWVGKLGGEIAYAHGAAAAYAASPPAGAPAGIAPVRASDEDDD